MREYDLIAGWYWTDRGRTVGVAEALAVAATLPAGSCILDIGCGNGVPITEALVNARHRVVGLDTSSGMLARFRVNLPGTPVVRGDVRHCPFSDGSFDAAVSWGMMFHLPRGDQAAAFASVSRVLKPGGSFLFTAAEIDGADDAGITGTMNGVTFHYYAVPSYRRLVAEYGFVLVDVHDDPGVSTYFLARKVVVSRPAVEQAGERDTRDAEYLPPAVSGHVEADVRAVKWARSKSPPGKVLKEKPDSRPPKILPSAVDGPYCQVLPRLKLYVRWRRAARFDEEEIGWPVSVGETSFEVVR